MSADDSTDPRPQAVFDEEPQTIGTIAQSRSHMDSYVEVFPERAREEPPSPADYQFGQPVYVTTDGTGERHLVVGVIYDTQLVDPDQGRTGPRLAPEEQATFTPGYVEEKRTLAGTALLGYARCGPGSSASGDDDPPRLTDVSHDMPPWPLELDAVVRRLPPAGIRAFHEADTQSGLQVGYYQRVLDVAGSFGPEVMIALIEQIRAATADEHDVLDVIERNVRWQATQARGVTR